MIQMVRSNQHRPRQVGRGGGFRRISQQKLGQGQGADHHQANQAKGQGVFDKRFSVGSQVFSQ